MEERQIEALAQIRSLGDELTRSQIDYRKSFSGFDTWQLWVIMIMFLLPLIVLLILIDKRKALLLGFFGFNYHVWFHYTNAVGIRLGLWEFPYQLIPFLPTFALDAALVPVCFMLLYQWTLNHDKNIYLYGTLLSAAMAFGLAPLMVILDFFHMFQGINYFYLFLFILAIFIFSKLVTNLFIWLQQKEK